MTTEERTEGIADLVARLSDDELVRFHGDLVDAQMRARAKPRVWSLPPEPGPEVTRVRDRHRNVWERSSGGWAWQSHGFSWLTLLADVGPLIDATEPEGDDHDRVA